MNPNPIDGLIYPLSDAQIQLSNYYSFQYITDEPQADNSSSNNNHTSHKKSCYHNPSVGNR